MTEEPKSSVPFHTHPEGPPDSLSLRDYVEGRLTRMAADAEARTNVLRDMYDEKIRHVMKIVEDQCTAQSAALDQSITAHGELTEQKFRASEQAMEKALTAQKEAVVTALAAVGRESITHAQAHQREHEAQANATGKTEARTDQRFEEANRFRQQIEAERATYARIDMLNVTERNARTVVEKLDLDMRIRLEKLETDARSRLEKIEGDLRQRIEAETRARAEALVPLTNWMQRSGGQMAVWIGMASVALAVVIFLANWATR